MSMFIRFSNCIFIWDRRYTLPKKSCQKTEKKNPSKNTVFKPLLDVFM